MFVFSCLKQILVEDRNTVEPETQADLSSISTNNDSEVGQKHIRRQVRITQTAKAH